MVQRFVTAATVAGIATSQRELDTLFIMHGAGGEQTVTALLALTAGTKYSNLYKSLKSLRKKKLIMRTRYKIHYPDQPPFHRFFWKMLPETEVAVAKLRQVTQCAAP